MFRSHLVLFLAASILLAFNISDSHAKRFTSQYCEFELPAGWECALEGAEWVCQSVNKERRKEAIIILAAKKRGTQDSLDEYSAYLKKTKTFTLPGGKTQVSDPKYTKMNTINNHRWVDSLHMASEVPGFYTRYLATVKEDLGVAVTFSVGKDHYDAYQGIFDSIIASLRVFRQKFSKAGNFKLKSKEENLLDNTAFIPDLEQKYDIKQRRRHKQGFLDQLGDNFWIIIIALMVGGAIVINKSRSKKKKKKKKKKSE